MGEIRNRIQDPELLKVLLYRTDEYGEAMLEKTIKKMAYAEEIAASFGFDPEIAAAIVVMQDLAVPCYGETGDRFLKEIDPDYTREKYAEKLAGKVLRGMEARASDAVCKGIQNVAQQKHTTPEEQIALLIQTGFAFADSLESRSLASLFFARYKDSIIEKTAKSGVLKEHVIPDNTLPKREKRKLSSEEKEKNRMQLRLAHKYFVTNFNEIPEGFTEGWGNISEALVAAYYVVGTDDKFLAKFIKQ